MSQSSFVSIQLNGYKYYLLIECKLIHTNFFEQQNYLRTIHLSIAFIGLVGRVFANGLGDWGSISSSYTKD